MSVERARPLDPAVAEQIQGVIDGIEGQAVVDRLFELAAIGGERLDPTANHPLHIATNRLALTPEDLAGRGYVQDRMQEAGMRLIPDHPLGLIGVYPGRHESLEPVVALSHTDTVPRGDIYDGTLGVLGAIEAVRVMHEQEQYADRDIMVVSLSIEESSRFGSALMGSRALFQGLSKEELDLRKGDDQSIREALGERGARLAQEPQFGPNGHMLATPYAVIELHVEQDKKLIDQGIDLGVVHSIASPVRYRAAVGEEPLQPDTRTYAHEKYLRLTVRGNADHSGATPMGTAHRADGLLETARILDELLGGQGDETVIAAGDIEVEEAAMNKVPGVTSAMLRLGADSEWKIEEARTRISAALERHEARLAYTNGRFPAEPFVLEEIARSDAGTFFAPEDMLPRQRAAFWLINSVNEAALKYAHDKVVGTVASLVASPDGRLALEVDIRGIELDSRDKTVGLIKEGLEAPALGAVALGEPLPGSGAPPVELDAVLASKTMDTIQHFDIGSVRSMFSAAGHDTQNAARAGIPSVMVFCQSEGGLAHHPDAYTGPENIGKGVKAQAALMIRLANEVPAGY